MKTKVESVITGRLDKFYNKSFEDHYKVLFDNGECFKVAFSKSYANQGNQIRELSFFKTFIIERCSNPPSCGQNRHWNSQKYNHNLSSDCLFAIKHFQVANEAVDESFSTDRNIPQAIKLLEEHPEYFKKNCSDFEALCSREYVEIEKTKKQLKSLMDENMSKKDYYASLDKKLKDFEQEKKQLEEERQKLKEEKEKMVFIKEKLVEMKTEVELEKQKILEQNSKTIDIDKCFEDIISFNFISEISKNKTGSKVAFD